MIAIFCFWCLNTVIYIACLNLILITNFWQSHLVEFLVLFFGRSTSQEHVKKIWHVQCHHERLVKPLYMINTCTNTSSTHAHMICDPAIFFQRKWLLFMVRKCIRTAYTMHIHCMYSVNTQYMRITESFFYGWNQSKRCVHAVHLLCAYTACIIVFGI